MSPQVFPAGALPGLAWDIKKAPEFRTMVQQSVGGYEVRTAFMQYPLWHFEVTFEFLRGYGSYTEIQTLQGFFLQMGGQATAFWYDDPSDDTITAHQFATGDGSTTAFQLTRTLGGFVEPIQNVKTLTSLTINGTPTTQYTLGATGIVTFNTPPATGAALAWTGTFYFLCRFEQDVSQFNQFLQNLWELHTLKFVSVKQ